MNPINRSNDPTNGIKRAADAGSRPKEVSMQHSGHHSMIGHLLLCGLGMIAAIVVGAVLGVNVAPLFCAAMMLWMVWGMAAPAVGKLRHRDQANQ